MKYLVIFALTLFVILSSFPVITQAQDSFDYVDLISKKDGETYVEGAIEIDILKAYELYKEGILFVDVNSSRGFKAGHIPGAVALDIKTTLTEESLAKHATKDQTVVFYCPHPACWGAANASAKAIVWGYTNVLFFEGGAAAWAEAGHPIDKG